MDVKNEVKKYVSWWRYWSKVNKIVEFTKNDIFFHEIRLRLNFCRLNWSWNMLICKKKQKGIKY